MKKFLKPRIIIGLLLCLTLITIAASPMVMAQTSDSGRIVGTLHNTLYDSPLPNAYITASNNDGYQRATITDQEGYYELELPPGSYSLRVIYLDVVLENSTDIFVGQNYTTNHDVFVSYAIDDNVRLTGTVTFEDQESGNPLLVDVRSIGSGFKNSTYADASGNFMLNISEGFCNISIYDGTELVHYEEQGPFPAYGQYTADITVEQNGGFTLGSFVNFLVNNWYYLAAIIVIVIGLLIGFLIMNHRLKKFVDNKKSKHSEEALKILTFTGRVIFVLISLYILLTLIGYFWTQYSNKTISYLSTWSNAIIIAFILILVARVILLFMSTIIDKIKAGREEGQERIPEAVVLLIQIVLKYSVILFFGFLVAVVLLSAIGLYHLIITGLFNFLAPNIGNLALVIIVIVIGYLSLRFVNTFLKDLKGKSTKYSPQMIKMLGSGIRFGILFIFGIIVIFSFLSMAGMQEMGTTIVIILTTMLGMVVAMAATGSIGNILSGVVIQSTKPYDKGDRVKLGRDKVADVEEITLFFTKVRTLNNEVVEIPNNLVLADEIFNYSQSGPVAIRIDVTLGYEIPVDLARDLLEMGAKTTKGILKEPRPTAIATELGNYAIGYSLRAYTDKPKTILSLRSSLIENIQDAFYDHGVEILSPIFKVQRDSEVPHRHKVIETYQKMKTFRDEDRKKAEEEAYHGMKMFDE